MKRMLCLLLLCLAALPAPARDREERSPDAQVLTHGFLYAHPDLKYRLEGLEAFEAEQWEDALDAFRESARWADKISQAMVAEMLWNGVGAPADRAAAYAWMDLAAERGYPSLVAKRELYWSELDADARERAIAVGQRVYAEYGDAVAKERLEHRLERGRRNMTGSRTGFVGNLQVLVPGEGGWTRLDGETYYDDKYWKPEAYFAWQDRIGELPPAGVVRVGPLVPREADSGGDAAGEEPR